MNLNKITAMRRRMEEVQAQLEAEGEAALGEIFTDYFKNNPTVHAITWTQYTPYYCDGGPCNFYVNEFSLSYENDGDFFGYLEEVKDSDENDQKAFDEMYELQEACFNDLMVTVFGDGVKITATREGFDITEYDHE